MTRTKFYNRRVEEQTVHQESLKMGMRLGVLNPMRMGDKLNEDVKRRVRVTVIRINTRDAVYRLVGWQMHIRN